MIYAADLFCGAGGSSTGLVEAVSELGLELNLLAVNHWQTAVNTHTINHPGARHMCADLPSAHSITDYIVRWMELKFGGAS